MSKVVNSDACPRPTWPIVTRAHVPRQGGAEDCTAVLDVEPRNAKALFRRAQESILLYGLSCNPPYNPPHNKIISDEEEERNALCVAELFRRAQAFTAMEMPAVAVRTGLGRHRRFAPPRIHLRPD